MTIQCVNNTDHEGRPFGGSVAGIGLQINWQEGPLRHGDREVPRNGAFVEEVADALIQRIEHYQESPFACDENAEALEFFRAGRDALARRQARRTEAGIEGTWSVDPDAERGPLPVVISDEELAARAAAGDEHGGDGVNLHPDLAAALHHGTPDATSEYLPDTPEKPSK